MEIKTVLRGLRISYRLFPFRSFKDLLSNSNIIKWKCHWTLYWWTNHKLIVQTRCDTGRKENGWSSAASPVQSESSGEAADAAADDDDAMDLFHVLFSDCTSPFGYDDATASLLLPLQRFVEICSWLWNVTAARSNRVTYATPLKLELEYI